MILADKIINERKKNGWSQEELAQRLSVSRQSISKWEGAQAVPDLQKIIKMAEVFGVSTDYLLKDELEPNDAAGYTENTFKDSTELRKVTMKEANAYLETVRKTAPMTAMGVTLCICSPITLIALTGISDFYTVIPEGLAAGIGMAMFLLSVATAVYMFIMSSAKKKEFAFLEKEAFETEYGVVGMVREKRSEYAPTHTRKIALGVVMCILSAVPLVLVACMSEERNVELLVVACVGFLLLLVSYGVNFIVSTCIIEGSFDKLLQENDYTLESKKSNAFIEKISGVYWSVVIAGYLGWSFLSGRWDITWMVWPVAGVLFGAVSGIIKAFDK